MIWLCVHLEAVVKMQHDHTHRTKVWCVSSCVYWNLICPLSGSHIQYNPLISFPKLHVSLLAILGKTFVALFTKKGLVFPLWLLSCLTDSKDSPQSVQINFSFSCIAFLWLFKVSEDLRIWLQTSHMTVFSFITLVFIWNNSYSLDSGCQEKLLLSISLQWPLLRHVDW